MVLGDLWGCGFRDSLGRETELLWVNERIGGEDLVTCRKDCSCIKSGSEREKNHVCLALAKDASSSLLSQGHLPFPFPLLHTPSKRRSVSCWHYNPQPHSTPIFHITFDITHPSKRMKSVFIPCLLLRGLPAPASVSPRCPQEMGCLDKI